MEKPQFCQLKTMEALSNSPKTVKGPGGILRCSEEIDEDSLPVLTCSYAKHVLNKIDEEVNSSGDRVFVVDGSAGKYDNDSSTHIAKDKLTFSLMTIKK